MDFKKGDLVRVRPGEHKFSARFGSLIERGFYTVMGVSSAGLVTIDYPLHLDCYATRFEKVDPNSLTKLELVVYDLNITKGRIK